MSYDAMAKIVDDIMKLAERASRFPAMIAADQPLDANKRRRWLRLREGYVSEINNLRARILAVESRGRLDTGARTLANDAQARLNGVMRLVFTAVPPPPKVTPAPTIATPRLLRPPVGGRSTSGPKRQSRSSAKGEGEYEGDEFSWNQLKSGARKAVAAAQIVGRLWAGGGAPIEGDARLRDEGTLIEAERQRKRDRDVAPAPRRDPTASGDRESGSGWAIAARQRHASPVGAPLSRSNRARQASPPIVHAIAQALDRVVDPTLLTRFAAQQAGGVSATQLRSAYASAAGKALAAELERLLAGRPPAGIQDLALGAVIAVSIAQATARFPIVPPSRIAPMAVLVHRALTPLLRARAHGSVPAAGAGPAASASLVQEAGW